MTTRVSGAVAIGFVARFVLSAPEDLPKPLGSRSEVSRVGGVTTGARTTIPLLNLTATSTKQSYVGTNQCFTCHRKQTDTWSETKHALAFTDIPKQYQKDAECLKCHVTGFGQPGGYAAGVEKDLLMVGCEGCHGPGASHVDAAKRFVLADPGEEAKIEKEMRESISKTPKDSVCIGCHVVQAHQKHPAYEGERLDMALSGPAGPCDPARAISERLTSITEPANYSSRYSIKTCGGCHYDQYRQWSAGKHSSLSAMLPAKYLNDQSCKDCHPNTAAIATKNMASDPHHHSIGVACETCHGPAFEHIQFNKQFVSGPALGPKLEQEARNSITKGKPATTCVQCHVRQTHKPHPQYDGQ
jgi:hypothetical protein